MNVIAIDRKMAAAGDETINPDQGKITFADFWKAYPRRVARKDAEKSWAKIPAETHRKILEAVLKARSTEDWRKDNGRFIPYPATYLNGERWEDELDTDMTMGECMWNCNGTREPGQPKCSQPGVKEKNGVIYCASHMTRVA